MMRQKGGTAVAAISTRSSPFPRAMAIACGGGMIPSCGPSSSMTRTPRTLMRSLPRVRSWRRGLRSKAITTSYLTCGGQSCYGFTLGGDFGQRLADAFLHAARAEVTAGAAPQGQGPPGGFASPRHQHVGNLLELRLADLISNLFLAVVELGPQPRRRQPRPHRLGIGRVTVGNRHDLHLHRREPQRERARVVLDQDGDEPLEAAEDRPMNDDRAVLGIVGADVFQIEALRHLVIELDRGALPLPPDRVGYVEVEFRSVERAVARVERVGLLRRFERVLQRGLGVSPRRDVAKEFLGTRR